MTRSVLYWLEKVGIPTIERIISIWVMDFYGSMLMSTTKAKTEKVGFLAMEAKVVEKCGDPILRELYLTMAAKVGFLAMEAKVWFLAMEAKVGVSKLRITPSAKGLKPENSSQ